MRHLDDPADEDFAPCADALVAGTVALMTTYADPCPASSMDADEQRALAARKIVSNLYFLRQHPGLCADLRQVMAMAHERWVALARRAGASQDGIVNSAAARQLH
jgi:hypothetical protein